MNIINVGPNQEETNKFTGDLYDWVVIWYLAERYEGRGAAIAKRKDGMFELHDLGHCSCFGPFDVRQKVEVLTQEKMYTRFNLDDCGVERKPNDYDYCQWKALSAKVTELLGPIA